MIFEFLQRHLPGWLASLVCGTVYAGLAITVWYKWDSAPGVFRYAGL